MTLKHLQRKVRILTEDMENPNPIELFYYLLERSAENSPGPGTQKVYGICISKKINDFLSEEKSVNEIYFSEKRTKKLIGTLADNAVTPVSLLYILDDIIGI